MQILGQDSVQINKLAGSFHECPPRYLKVAGNRGVLNARVTGPPCGVICYVVKSLATSR
jgi:hypothetical protein